MLISVILTITSGQALSPRTVHSVLSQKLPGNHCLEFIVFYDSPQGIASAAMNGLHEECPSTVTVKLIKSGMAGRGAAAARNSALAAATGEWIVFLGDDDVLLDGALEALLEQACRSGADFCAGHYAVIAENGNAEAANPTDVHVEWPGLDALLVRKLFPLGSFVIRRRIVEQYFNTTLGSVSDWLFLLDNLKHAQVTVLDRPVLQVRRAAASSLKAATATAADHALVYALHPAAHLTTQRKAMLASLGGADIDPLADQSRSPAILRYLDTAQGRFLLCNPAETIQSSLLRHGEFEPLAARIAIAIVGLKPGAVIDIGANIGTFSVPVALALPECAVLSVEPQRLVFMQLCANLLGNRLMNARPLNMAVGKAHGPNPTIRVPCFDVFTERFTGSVSLDSQVQRTRGAIAGVAEPSQWAEHHDEVPLQPLDTLARGLDVAFLKIDVEGMEEKVLASGENLLRTQRPSLFFETWTLDQFREQRLSLLRYVMGLGYAVFQVNQDCFAYHPKSLKAEQVMQAFASLGLRSLSQ